MMLSEEINLFNSYITKDIKNYESLKEPGKAVAIKITFKDGKSINIHYKNENKLINVNFENGKYTNNYKDEEIEWS